MKKSSALFLALCMILSVFVLSACGGNSGSGAGNNPGGSGDSVYDTVAAAIENTLKAKSYDANVGATYKEDLMGRVSEASMSANLKAVELDTNAPKVYFDGQQSASGYNNDYDMYYDGVWKYFDINPQGGYKYQCSYAEFAEEAGAPQNIIVALPESLFAGVAGTKNDDGSLSVTLTLDEATVEELYKELVTSVVYDVVGNDLNQATTKDAVITLTVADGYIRDYKIAFVCEIVAGQDKVTYDVSQFVEFLSCDQPVTVTPPANLENFYEMSWG